jgi:hypothetical protein
MSGDDGPVGISGRRPGTDRRGHLDVVGERRADIPEERLEVGGAPCRILFHLVLDVLAQSVGDEVGHLEERVGDGFAHKTALDRDTVGADDDSEVCEVVFEMAHQARRVLEYRDDAAGCSPQAELDQTRGYPGKSVGQRAARHRHHSV